MTYHLTNRVVVEITGEDCKTFLQGIISNDINNAKTSHLLYAFFLSPQGKFLSDMFITTIENGYLLDLPKGLATNLLAKFKMYKLRSKVDIILTEKLVVASFNKEDESYMEDPRTPKMGYRSYQMQAVPSSLFKEYEAIRIQNKIPDAELDFLVDKSFPLEFGANELNAIDYKKGCYVGQEVTARTHHRGVVRKGMYHIEILAGNLEKGDELTNDGLKSGIALGRAGNIALALLYHENITIGCILTSANAQVKVTG